MGRVQGRQTPEQSCLWGPASLHWAGDSLAPNFPLSLAHNRGPNYYIEVDAASQRAATERPGPPSTVSSLCHSCRGPNYIEVDVDITAGSPLPFPSPTPTFPPTTSSHHLPTFPQGPQLHRGGRGHHRQHSGRQRHLARGGWGVAKGGHTYAVIYRPPAAPLG